MYAFAVCCGSCSFLIRTVVLFAVCCQDPTFGETGEDLGASGSLSRRLRRSAASLLHSAKSRHWAKVAVVVSVLFSLVAGVLLVALCAGKSKSKE